jgi:Na+-transporting NADH:ubiquinone oxidoreductase subunit C
VNTSKPAYIILFMLAVCVVFGAALATVQQVTADALAKNERYFKNRALAKAFLLEVDGQSPTAYETAIGRFLEKGRLPDGPRAWEVFATRPPLERRVGFVFSGNGFWGPIKGILVLSPDLKTVTNLQILEHQETPGLGARIEEAWFTDQFKGLEVGWEQPMDKRIIIGASSDPKARNRVDAVTGASQTSMALMKSLNTQLDRFRAAYSKGQGG